jgi:alpha-L-fucosidase
MSDPFESDLVPAPKTEVTAGAGHQRLSLEKLRAWERLGFGMFIHFGMSTYDNDEFSKGDKPSTLYAPDQLDVDQWISVARDAGMKYAILTTKHVAGHCLWPTRLTDYQVGNSGNKTDVVGAFVEACRKKGILPGLYYCSWDNHNRFGSVTPSDPAPVRARYGDRWYDPAYTTAGYHDFQLAQLGELLTEYGSIGEVWIDIPGVLPRAVRDRHYAQIAAWQPDALIVSNNGISDGSKFDVDYSWPTDIVTIERWLPNSHTGHVAWREIEGKRYYLPGEVCDPIGKDWFWTEKDRARSDAELLGMYLVSRSRGANLVLNVPPDRHGLIPDGHRDALLRLRRNIDRLGPV